MSPSSTETGLKRILTGPGSEQRLLTRVQRGSASAAAALFARYAPWLRRRARGRHRTQWARSGGVATSDLVQDVLQHTVARLTWFESSARQRLAAPIAGAPWRTASRTSGAGATRRLDLARLAPGEVPLRPVEDAAPQ